MIEDKKTNIPRNVWVLGIVSFLNDVASEMVYPVIPIFLTSVLGAPITIVGLIEGLAGSVANILMAAFGLISDRIQKRKVFVAWGYSLAAVSHLIMFVAGSWLMVLIGRLANRTGKGIRTSARDALISESTDKSVRGKSFGLHRTMDTFGAVLGPLLSIVILKQLSNNYHSLFLLAFIPAAISIFLLMAFVRERKKEKIDFKAIHFEWTKANSSFKIFLLISFVFAIGNSSGAFMILRAQNLGMPVGLIIFTYVLYNATSALFSMPAGIMADKIGARKVLFVGFLMYALVYFLFGWIDQAVYVWVLFPLFGLYTAFTEGVGKAYISKLIPHEIAASAFGIYQTLMGVGTLIASVLAGFLWTYAGVRSPFYFGACVAILSAIMFFTLTKRVSSTQPTA